jgi:hypothetical protein
LLESDTASREKTTITQQETKPTTNKTPIKPTGKTGRVVFKLLLKTPPEKREEAKSV